MPPKAMRALQGEQPVTVRACKVSWTGTWMPWWRMILPGCPSPSPREITEFATPYGPVRCKVAEIGPGQTVINPEYEDLKRIALEKSVPLKEVMEKVKAGLLQSGEVSRPKLKIHHG